jgi:hypothetical protein
LAGEGSASFGETPLNSGNAAKAASGEGDAARCSDNLGPEDEFWVVR